MTVLQQQQQPEQEQQQTEDQGMLINLYHFSPVSEGWLRESPEVACIENTQDIRPGLIQIKMKSV